MCTVFTFFVKPSENRDRRNVWQATKHRPCKALFAPYQILFTRRDKKLKKQTCNLNF